MHSDDAQPTKSVGEDPPPESPEIPPLPPGVDPDLADARRRPSRRDALLVGIGAVLTAGAALSTTDAVLRSGVPPLEQTATDLGRLPQFDGTDDDARAALQSYLDAWTGSSLVLVGDYLIDGELFVPPTITNLRLAAGTRLRFRGTPAGLRRHGSLNDATYVSITMERGSTRIHSARTLDFTEGEYVVLSGKDGLSGTGDRYGYLRRVIGARPDSIDIDSPIPRPIAQAPRITRVSLAPPLTIQGGELLHVEPTANTRPLIRFFAVENPIAKDIDIHDNGGSGIIIAHCWGGFIDCIIHDLLDDNENYFGYGVSVGGTTRDATILSTCTRVRHAVTTNASGLNPGVGWAGEPENCHFEPVAIDCSNKSVDTHRLGWGITIVPHVTRGGGGVQVRADNTTVIGGSIVDCSGTGILVRQVDVAPMISGVQISGLKGDSAGIRCLGGAEIRDTSVVVKTGPALELWSGATVQNCHLSSDGDATVVIHGRGNDLTQVTFAGSADTQVLNASSSRPDIDTEN